MIWLQVPTTPAASVTETRKPYWVRGVRFDPVVVWLGVDGRVTKLFPSIVDSQLKENFPRRPAVSAATLASRLTLPGVGPCLISRIALMWDGAIATATPPAW